MIAKRSRRASCPTVDHPSTPPLNVAARAPGIKGFSRGISAADRALEDEADGAPYVEIATASGVRRFANSFDADWTGRVAFIDDDRTTGGVLMFALPPPARHHASTSPQPRKGARR
jgi:hypothetical protein